MFPKCLPSILLFLLALSLFPLPTPTWSFLFSPNLPPIHLQSFISLLRKIHITLFEPPLLLSPPLSVDCLLYKEGKMVDDQRIVVALLGSGEKNIY